MKFKSLLLISLFLFSSLIAFSQRNPDKEILVFFNKGVSQNKVKKNGKSLKVAVINNSSLKAALYNIEITESMLEVALPKFNKKDTLKILRDGKQIKQADMTKLFRIKVTKSKNRKDIIASLNKLPEVLYAEANGLISPSAIPSDTRFNQQWGLRNTVFAGRDIHAEQAWDIYTGNANNIIAVIDGGIDISHPDLNNKISGGDIGIGWNGHGVHVSGIAAAESNNNQGVSGVDWNARIHAKRIDNADDAATYQAIVDAVDFSNNVHVLNNSYGLTYQDRTPGRYSTTVHLAFVYAYNANRTSVVSMGNHHQPTGTDVIGYPAGFGNLIAVGATNNTDGIANFSAQGSHIDVSAPGVGIMSTFTGGNYINMDGTSMATPFVSGIASLLKGFNPSLANDDIENIIKLSADDQGVNGFDDIFGFGRVNAEEALKYLQAPYSLHQWTTSGGSVVNSTGQYTHQFIGVSGIASGTYLVKRHEVRKTVNFPQGFYELEGVWGRGAFTNGWNLRNPNLGEGFCELVPGSESTTGASLRTYVYEIWSINGSYLGYYPSSPSNVQFAYTALGTPAPYISGTSIVCSSNSTFTLRNRPPGSTVKWKKSKNLIYVSGQGTNNYTVRANGNGNGWVQAEINGTVFRKTFLVGSPTTPIISCYHNKVGMNSQIEAFASSTGADNYTWSIGGGTLLNGQGTSEVLLRTSSRCLYDLTIRVTTSNSCGNSAQAMKSIPYDCSGGPSPLKISPNPATAEATIEISSENEKFDKNTEWELEVYNPYFILQEKQNKLKGNKFKLNTSSWKEGVYIIRAIFKGEVLNGKLIIKK